MSEPLIKEVLKIEAEADQIVSNAKQKAEQIINNIHNETGSIKTNIEKEYHQRLETVKAKFADLQKSEEDRLRNEFESTKKNLLRIDDKIMEDAIHWVIKHICGDSYGH
ncbi:MAG: hypothetical protein NG747_09110 [Candidatus Brocadia sp.]|nr:hypothetical protein [Candidatus Brocadia sp.]